MITIKPVTIAALIAISYCVCCLKASKLMGQPPLPSTSPKVQSRDIDRKFQEPIQSTEEIEAKMFPDGIAHAFGKVQRGTPLQHAFRVVNTSTVPLEILYVRGGGRSRLIARSSKKVLQPNEEGRIEVTIDTQSFLNTRTFTVFLTLSCNGRLKEHRLWVQADSREDLAFFPDSIDFGKITRGDTPTQCMIVAVPDQPNLQVKAATCENKFIQVKVEELDRGKTRAFYQVSATVRADILEGKLHEAVELSTNNPAMPRLLVPLWAVVESPK
jgi:hypothetical protein